MGSSRVYEEQGSDDLGIGVAQVRLWGTMGSFMNSLGSKEFLSFMSLAPIVANSCVLLRVGTPLKPEQCHF